MTTREDDISAWMPWFPRDFLAATRGLSAVQRDAYATLLQTMWIEHGSLPFDPAELARITQLTPIEWVAVWSRISKFFEVDGDTITQARLGRERQKALALRRARSDAGRKGATSPRRKPAAEQRSKASAKAQPSPSPSPSPPPSSTPRSGGGAAPSRLPTDLDIALAAFCAAWKRRYRQDYITTATDRSQLGRLLCSLTPEQARALPAAFERYLADAGRFVAEEKRHSLAWFLRDDGANKYRTAVPVVSAKEARNAAALGRFLETAGSE